MNSIKPKGNNDNIQLDSDTPQKGTQQDLIEILSDKDLRKLIPQTDIQTGLSHDFLNPICAIISVMGCILDGTFEPDYLKVFISETDFLKYKERYNINDIKLEEGLESYIESIDGLSEKIRNFKGPLSNLLQIFSTISIMIEGNDRFQEHIKK